MSQPDFICNDVKNPFRICHYSQMSFHTSPVNFMKVVVQRESEADAGVVITAFVTSRIRTGEEVIYGERIP